MYTPEKSLKGKGVSPTPVKLNTKIFGIRFLRLLLSCHITVWYKMCTDNFFFLVQKTNDDKCRELGSPSDWKCLLQFRFFYYCTSFPLTSLHSISLSLHSSPFYLRIFPLSLFSPSPLFFFLISPFLSLFARLYFCLALSHSLSHLLTSCCQGPSTALPLMSTRHTNRLGSSF